MTQKQKDEIAEIQHMRDGSRPNLFEDFMSSLKSSEGPEPEPEPESEAEPVDELEEEEEQQRQQLQPPPQLRDISPISSSAESLSEPELVLPFGDGDGDGDGPDARWQHQGTYSMPWPKHDQVVNSMMQEMQMLKYKYPHLYPHQNQPVNQSNIWYTLISADWNLMSLFSLPSLPVGQPRGSHLLPSGVHHTKPMNSNEPVMQPMGPQLTDIHSPRLILLEFEP